MRVEFYDKAGKKHLVIECTYSKDSITTRIFYEQSIIEAATRLAGGVEPSDCEFYIADMGKLNWKLQEDYEEAGKELRIGKRLKVVLSNEDLSPEDESEIRVEIL